MKRKILFDHRGIETIEAAITFPIAILFMLATVNLGLVVFGQQTVQSAARYGARMGSVAQQCPACWAVTNAESAIKEAPMVQDPQVTILAPGGSAGSILEVRVSGQIPNFFGGLAAIFPGLYSTPFNVSAQATFRQEGW